MSTVQELQRVSQVPAAAPEDLVYFDCLVQVLDPVGRVSLALAVLEFQLVYPIYFKGY